MLLSVHQPRPPVPLAAGSGYGCRRGWPGVSNSLGLRETGLSPELMVGPVLPCPHPSGWEASQVAGCGLGAHFRPYGRAVQHPG